MADLDRFKIAQDAPVSGFDQALREIRGGGKRSHWIWYVFPQIAGLGMSYQSQQYAIRGADEAAAYLRDPVLFSRLLTITQAVHDRLTGPTAVDVTTLMGSGIDAQKLVSSLTLFGAVARQLGAHDGGQKLIAFADIADQVLALAEAQGYPRCRFTLDRLG
jgi:uncharacterized protein (DUF1810 family)